MKAFPYPTIINASYVDEQYVLGDEETEERVNEGTAEQVNGGTDERVNDETGERGNEVTFERVNAETAEQLIDDSYRIVNISTSQNEETGERVEQNAQMGREIFVNDMANEENSTEQQTVQEQAPQREVLNINNQQVVKKCTIKKGI